MFDVDSDGPVPIQNSIFPHERLPYLSNLKNKSFFGSKIAFSFDLKESPIFLDSEGI